MAVELQQLRYFAAIAEEGQVSAAAQRLYLTQPALSQALRRLEREVGVELLTRHPHGVTLNPAGVDVLVEARAAIDAADRLVAAAAAHRRGRQQDLVIGALPESLGALQAPLDAFKRARPDIRVEVQLLDLRNQQEMVRRREVDIALIWEPGSGFEWFELSFQPLVLAMTASHRLSRLAQVTIDDLDGEVFPGAHRDVPRPWIDRFWLTDLRGTRPKVTDVPATTAMQVVAQVMNGQCVCPTTADVADQYVRGATVTRPIVDARPLASGFAWQRNTPAVSAFVETLPCTAPHFHRSAVAI